MTGGEITPEHIPIINEAATAVNNLKDDITDKNQNDAAKALKILGEALEVKASTDNVEEEEEVNRNGEGGEDEGAQQAQAAPEVNPVVKVDGDNNDTSKNGQLLNSIMVGLSDPKVVTL